MKLSVFSIRTIMGIIIGMMGLLALILALLSGYIHQDLVLENQQTMMKEIIQVEVKERLNDLNDISQDLGLSLQSTTAFKKAFSAKDNTSLVDLLNNQFHQYFVTTGVIKLEQLTLFDKNFSIMHESTEGSVFFNQGKQTACSHLINRARLRTGSQRLTILQDLCLYDNRPIYAVIVPVGGIRVKGYLMIVTDPILNLAQMKKNLGMPLQLRLNNDSIVFQSATWPDNESNSLISSYKLTASADVPILSILTAQNINDLSTSLQQARLDVLFVTGIGTLVIVVFSISIIRKTMLTPLNRLTNKLHDLHSNQSLMGEQLKVTGTKEMHSIIEGFNDMSQKLKNLYQSLEHMAYTDSLTKLPNRNQFQESLELKIQLHQHINKPFVLFLMDLDRFKGVNDTLGHHVGDILLKEVSIRLHEVLRDDDIIIHVDQKSISQLSDNLVARLGGDEFSAILTSIHTHKDSIVVAEKLIKAMKQPFKVNDHQLTIGLSIGIAIYPEHGNDMHTLISHADVAMYNAKSNNCSFSIYDSTQNKHSLHNLTLEQDLFKSIHNNELVLYYQPKVSALNKNVIGSEALIRWQHPTLGLILPDNFIPIAEQTGFIQPLTEWVLNQALEDCAKTLLINESLSVSVNLSALNLRDEKIALTINNALKKWSIPPSLLTLELTESAIMTDPEFAVMILTKLDAMGVSLSIDDFGTGYSSLAYIKKLPIDEIKIDKYFIQGIRQNNSNEAIVRAVLVLAHHMNLSIVAEGVEDTETLDMLIELDCDIIQGYYIAKPMPFNDYIAWLTQR